MVQLEKLKNIRWKQFLIITVLAFAASACRVSGGYGYGYGPGYGPYPGWDRPPYDGPRPPHHHGGGHGGGHGGHNGWRDNDRNGDWRNNDRGGRGRPGREGQRGNAGRERPRHDRGNNGQRPPRNENDEASINSKIDHVAALVGQVKLVGNDSNFSRAVFVRGQDRLKVAFYNGKIPLASAWLSDADSNDNDSTKLGFSNEWNLVLEENRTAYFENPKTAERIQLEKSDSERLLNAAESVFAEQGA